MLIPFIRCSAVRIAVAALPLAMGVVSPAPARAAAPAVAPSALLVPRVVGEWIHVYQPAGDVFPGPDSARFKAGRHYAEWQVNDHTILKGPDGRWHAIGITHPAVAAGEPNPHEAEWLAFHAVSPVGALNQTLAPGAWRDQPKLLPPAERPGDVFPGPDSPRFKAGRHYAEWQVNDHTILKGPDGRWHAIGITHPAVAAGEPNPHEAEWFAFHAVSPVGALKQTLAPGAWRDQPKLLPPAERPGEGREHHSPFILRYGDEYRMIYGPSPIRYATSKDLWHWTPRGPLFRQDGGARDPSVLYHHGTYYLSYTTKLSILVRTSRDLVHWSEPTTVFSLAPDETGGPESPTLLALHGGFYLIWCRWDAKLSAAGFSYQDRSWVYHSDDPLNFRDRSPVAELPGHAPELFQDEDGDWWISSAERPHRGVSLARVRWEPRPDPASAPAKNSPP